MKDFSVSAPDRQIDRIYVDAEQRDGSYKMPSNHCHPYFEIYYLESGSCRFFIRDRMLDVHSGDLLLIPPQTLHYTRYLFGPCRRVDLFFRKTDLGADVIPVFPEQDRFFRHWQLMQIPDFFRDTVSALFSRMLGEVTLNDSRTQPLLRCRLQELLLLCSRIGLSSEILPSDIHTTDRSIVLAAEYMRENFREPLRTEDIAASAGLSPDYLTKKFRQATGTGVHEYLRFLRLQQAALELVETRDSVTDIALRCGFSGGNYFKDCFRAQYGCSPREYRAGQR